MWGTSTCRIFAFRDSNKFNMQHDHALKKMNFDLLTPSPRVVERWGGGWGGGGGGSAGKTFATMLLHFMNPVNLLCNMTMF